MMHCPLLPGSVVQSGSGVVVHDAEHLDRHATHEIVDRVLESPEHTMQLLQRCRSRLEAAGLHTPTIAVRYRNLCVSTKASLRTQELPSIAAPVLRRFRPALRVLRPSHVPHRRHHAIIDNASGILRPGVFTLLLGPPQSGKTTLLKTLAGLNQKVPGLRGHLQRLQPSRVCA